jgi:RNAse (barnase) inhibitor barstar
MVWKLALVLDSEYSPKDLGRLVHQMPIWAVETQARIESASEIRHEASALWAPDPPFTLFRAASRTDHEETCRHILGTLLEHHPNAACLEIIGVTSSPKLMAILGDAGFEPASGQFHEGLPFRKPVDKLTSVGEVVLDATHWKTSDHFYDSFFKAVGAPAWHGRNFDALNDSIVTGNINQIEVPYRIFIENLSQAGSEARAIAEGFIELIRQFEAEGCPIEIQIDQVT